MRLLKVFVVLMGVTLVVGSGVLFTRIYEKVNGSSSKPEKMAHQPSSITFPAGGKIVSSSPMGNGVALLVTLPSGGGQLLLVNQDGALWQRISLEPTISVDATPSPHDP
ncbi:MAG: hypothetical protein HQL72_02955 [Magnetococcales bacterium]|nr:hypothetical protein [Magnetococcales bacterium]